MNASPSSQHGADDATLIPHTVLAPTSEEELREALASAARNAQSVLTVGNTTKLDFGNMVRPEVLISLAGLAPVVEHAPGDLVVRVGASVALDALQRELAAAGQRLAIEEVVPGTSIGGLFSTGLSGPSRLRYGAVRDLAIGCRFVLADGQAAKAGGRVVKNVAGYDLTKLLCGALGTLGVVTEVTFRLHPRPRRTCFVAASLRPAEACAAAAAIAASPLQAAAIELDEGDAGATSLVASFEGSDVGAPGRAAQAAAIIGHGATTSEQPPPWWGALPGPVVLKAAVPPGSSAAMLRALRSAAPTGQIRGSIALGLLYLGLEESPTLAIDAVLQELRDRLLPLGGHLVVLRAPDPVRAGLDCFGPVAAAPLMQAVKHEFDPRRILAPGRFVAGI